MWLKRWGSAGDVEELPEGSQEGLPDPNQFRIRPAEYEPTPDAQPASRRVTFEGLPPPAADAELAEPRPSGMPGFPCRLSVLGICDTRHVMKAQANAHVLPPAAL